MQDQPPSTPVTPGADVDGENPKKPKVAIGPTTIAPAPEEPSKDKANTSKQQKDASHHQAGKGKGHQRTSHGSTSNRASTSSHKGHEKKAKKKRKPLPIEILLGDNLVNAAGEKKPTKELLVENGVVGMYFAAKWCPPCKLLLPQILLLFEEVRKREVKFEMVYVSFDKNAESFQEYLSVMPWWAVDFADEERREEMAITYNVRGIPLFVLIDPNTQETICKEGRSFVSHDPTGEHFPWKDGLLRPSVKHKKADKPGTPKTDKHAAHAISAHSHHKASESTLPESGRESLANKSKENVAHDPTSTEDEGTKDSPSTHHPNAHKSSSGSAKSVHALESKEEHHHQ